MLTVVWDRSKSTSDNEVENEGDLETDRPIFLELPIFSELKDRRGWKG
jgi:hypothetical protein